MSMPKRVDPFRYFHSSAEVIRQVVMLYVRYEIETDDLAKLSEGMQKQCRPFHPFFDRTRSAHMVLSKGLADHGGRC
jgi:hypothetical protein